MMKRVLSLLICMTFAVTLVPPGEAAIEQWNLEFSGEGDRTYRILIHVDQPSKCAASVGLERGAAWYLGIAIDDEVWTERGPTQQTGLGFDAHGEETITIALDNIQPSSETNHSEPSGDIVIFCQHPFTVEHIDQGNETLFMSMRDMAPPLVHPGGYYDATAAWTATFASPEVELHAGTDHGGFVPRFIETHVALSSPDLATHWTHYDAGETHHFTGGPPGGYQIAVDHRSIGWYIDWNGFFVGFD